MNLRRLTLLTFLSGLSMAFFAACQSSPGPEMNTKPAGLVESAPPEQSIPEEVPPEPELPVVPEEDPVAETVTEQAMVNEEPVPEVGNEQIQFFGTIQYVELEGGFFGIVTEDGRKFFPQYLDNEFKQDGLNVRVTAILEEEVFGIQMWGAPIKLVSIEPL